LSFNPANRLFPLVLVIFLGGVQTVPAQGPPGVWLDVPFVKQNENGCGSASIAMLLQYWSAHGASIAAERSNEQEIFKTLYSPKAHGIFAKDLERYIRDSGFRTFAIKGSWTDLRENLVKGRPLLVTLQPRGPRSPLHYIVVTGMDWKKSAVFVNDPARGKLLRVEREEFENEWRGVGNWMLLAVPEAAR
jgi:ABC-type bacteriocin/lantibiotic exporter with double-glycine peptidase domain